MEFLGYSYTIGDLVTIAGIKGKFDDSGNFLFKVDGKDFTLGNKLVKRCGCNAQFKDVICYTVCKGDPIAADMYEKIMVDKGYGALVVKGRYR